MSGFPFPMGHLMHWVRSTGKKCEYAQRSPQKLSEVCQKPKKHDFTQGSPNALDEMYPLRKNMLHVLSPASFGEHQASLALRPPSPNALGEGLVHQKYASQCLYAPSFYSSCNIYPRCIVPMIHLRSNLSYSWIHHTKFWVRVSKPFFVIFTDLNLLLRLNSISSMWKR